MPKPDQNQYQNWQWLQRLPIRLEELLKLNLVTWSSVADRKIELKSIKEKVENLRKNDDFVNFKKLIKALDHPIRLEILIAVINGITCPCELEYITGLAQATVSHHISILDDAGLISRDKEGKWIILKSEKQNLLNDFITL